MNTPSCGDTTTVRDPVICQVLLIVSLVSWEEYARGIHLFLSGLYPGFNVDFTQRNLVGIGHSMGCIALYVTPLSLFPSLTSS